MTESRLPNAEQGWIEERKIRDYLLNAAHVQGASKARFFKSHGFSVESWQAFASALREQGLRNSVTRTTPTPWGMRYQVDCHCPTPDGVNPCIRTVWEINDSGVPRLLTAHPQDPVSKPEDGAMLSTSSPDGEAQRSAARTIMQARRKVLGDLAK